MHAWTVEGVARTYPLITERPGEPAAASLLVDCRVPLAADLRALRLELELLHPVPEGLPARRESGLNA